MKEKGSFNLDGRSLQCQRFVIVKGKAVDLFLTSSGRMMKGFFFGLAVCSCYKVK